MDVRYYTGWIYRGWEMLKGKLVELSDNQRAAIYRAIISCLKLKGSQLPPQSSPDVPAATE